MKKFYEVRAKCGHVGRKLYYEGTFYERANDASEAALIVRGRGRVKHDHKDAILSVKEITKENFIIGSLEKQKQIYYRFCNRREQTAHWEEIKDYLRNETNNGNRSISREKPKKVVYIGKETLRKPLKYIKMYPDLELDLEVIGA